MKLKTSKQKFHRIILSNIFFTNNNTNNTTTTTTTNNNNNNNNNLFKRNVVFICKQKNLQLFIRSYSNTHSGRAY